MDRSLPVIVAALAAFWIAGCKSAGQGADGGGGGSAPAYECKMMERPACNALVVRKRTPRMELEDAVGKAFGAIMQRLMVLGEMPAGPPFAVYYNNDENDLDVEFGFPVSRKLKGAGEVKPAELPPMRGASCVFTGHYSGIAPAYASLKDWAARNGHKTKGMSFEFYQNDPAKTKPEELKTIVFLPLE